MFRINRKIQISAVQFCVFYPAFIYTMCNAFTLPKFLKWFYFKGGTEFSALIAFLIIGLCLFIFLFTLLSHRKTIKPLAILFAVLSAPSAYFIYKYGVAIDRSMLMNVINTNPTEVSDLLSLRMIPYMLVLMGVPIVLTSITRIHFADSGRYLLGSAKVIVGALSLVVGLLYWQFNGISRAVNSSNKYVIQTLIPINYLQGFGSMAQNSIESALRKHGKKIAFTGRVTSNENLVVVLVIGESSRQQNFSLYGYRRQNTNPLLSKEKNLHVLNGTAKKGSTLYALPEILVKNDVPLPLATHALGIETSCYVNYTLYDNCDAVGEVPVSNCKYKTCYDGDVVPMLSDNLKSLGKLSHSKFKMRPR
jgi:lipid A ethanolaminephosphotransferase